MVIRRREVKTMASVGSMLIGLFGNKIIPQWHI